MQLSDVRQALREHWLSAVLAFVLCVGLGAAAAYLPAPSYEAEAVLTVTPRETGGNSVSAANFVPSAVRNTTVEWSITKLTGKISGSPAAAMARRPTWAV